MAWEQMKDPASGRLTEWRDVGRWRLQIREQFGGWQWQVTKTRDTPGPRGEWHDTVAIRTEETSRAAHAVGGLVLRATVMTPARAKRIAKAATVHGYYHADYWAASYCPQCRQRVEIQVDVNRDRLTPSGRMRPIKSMALTQIHAALAEHLMDACEHIPHETVKDILGGRHG
jgi:hypothetical protein